MRNRVNASTVAIAFRALRKEILGFDFHYPLDIDRAAGPRDSLHYYLYSDALKWDAMRMDSAGIPRTWDRTTGITYWPGYIAWYALVQLGHYLRGKGAQHLDIFVKQIDWLETHAVTRDDGAVVWTMNFDYREGNVLLRGPWVSAHAQGLAISAVVRGWRVTRRPHLLELLRRSADIFDLDESRGGIRAQIGNSIFFTEKPGCALPGILDGFATSLLGLYDLDVETNDAKVAELFRTGTAGLKELLPWWDYRKKWSWYGCHEYLSPPAYHCLNRSLLSVLGGLTNDADLKELADCWNPANLSRIERAQIYLSFLATKNAARLRHRTWLQKSLPES
jgi:D-glucuronyl C5-epimerase-like protein